MTTPADALEVMTMVAACHHRTAPRIDDRDAAIVMATVWAELFTAHNLALADLLAAVKERAAHHPDAPEPAEIITFARAIRQRRDAETGPTPEYEARCEAKGADAAELAALRRSRTGQITEGRPRLAELVAQIADQKAVSR